MLYTEEAVRAGLRVRDGRRVFYLPEGSRLTPAARDWLRQEGVTVVPHAETPPAAYRTPDGAAFAEKPEHMTHLRGNILVPKTHPRIAFRGGIDTLEAELLLCAQAADGPLRQTLCAMLDFARSLIRADVLDEPVQAVRFLGLDDDGLREHSHHPEREEGNGARTAATALVAFGTLVLLFAAAVVVFLLIAELTRGQWMLAGSAVVVLAFLLWLGNRLVHVAANQNKNPLG